MIFHGILLRSCIFLSLSLMNYIDITLCIPLAWGFYKGFTKGLIIEVATLVALIAGSWGSVKLADHVTNFLKSDLNWNSPYLPIISFALIFLLIIIGVYLVAKIIEHFAKAIALGTINKLLGACFGMFKFALLLSIFFYFFEAVGKSIEVIPAKTRKESILYTPLARIAPLVIPGLKK